MIYVTHIKEVPKLTTDAAGSIPWEVLHKSILMEAFMLFL